MHKEIIESEKETFRAMMALAEGNLSFEVVLINKKIDQAIIE